jgi:hypothetical protein
LASLSVAARAAEISARFEVASSPSAVSTGSSGGALPMAIGQP